MFTHCYACDRQTDRQTDKNNICKNMYQENYLLQEMTDGISTENVNMQEYSSNYYDMVARPEIKKKKIYRRVFIRRETKDEN